MKLPPDSLAYLQDKHFASSYEFQLEFDKDDFKLYSRIDWLAQMVTEKHVIHLGCVDHNLSTIKKKLKKNLWLHARLVDTSKRCLGIDINESGIRCLREELGYNDVLAGNIINQNYSEIENSHWEYIILGEIIEHMNNPLDSLRKIHHQYKNSIEKIIITVPNAFALRNFKHSGKGIERINSEHRYWFTPYTICKILTITGYNVRSLRACGGNKNKARSFFKNFQLQRYPLLRNGLIVEADF